MNTTDRPTGAGTFQFHKGTIRTVVTDKTILTNLHFNSIKVQLELQGFRVVFDNSVFQFHKGTIRTNRRNRNALIQISFQFHKGTIRTLCRKPNQPSTSISIP